MLLAELNAPYFRHMSLIPRSPHNRDTWSFTKDRSRSTVVFSSKVSPTERSYCTIVTVGMSDMWRKNGRFTVCSGMLSFVVVVCLFRVLYTKKECNILYRKHASLFLRSACGFSGYLPERLWLLQAFTRVDPGDDDVLTLLIVVVVAHTPEI